MDEREVRKLHHAVIMTGAATVLLIGAWLLSRSEVIAWLLAMCGFAFVVVVLLYNADTRPKPKHHVQ